MTPDAWKFEVAAVVILVIGLVLGFKIGTGGRRRTSDTAAGSAPTN
jgi:hypothetical protein